MSRTGPVPFAVMIAILVIAQVMVSAATMRQQVNFMG